MTPYRIAIVSGVFHQEILDEMIAVAKQSLATKATNACQIVFEIQVPGAYEIPLAVKKILEKGVVDGVVVLGAIEKGETLDGSVMGGTVSNFLMKLQLNYMIPIGIGIIGPGATFEQMQARAASKSRQAVKATLDMITFMKQQ